MNLPLSSIAEMDEVPDNDYEGVTCYFISLFFKSLLVILFHSQLWKSCQ